MLVFQAGQWCDVSLPECMDPSWGISQQTQAAYLVLKGLSWTQVEAAVYAGSRGNSIAAHKTKKNRVV